MKSQIAHCSTGCGPRFSAKNPVTPHRKLDPQFTTPVPHEDVTGSGGIISQLQFTISLSHIAPSLLVVTPFSPPDSRAALEGGVRGGSDPPYFVPSAAPDPRSDSHHGGPGPPLSREGRSRHSDPCGKARIPEG